VLAPSDRVHQPRCTDQTVNVVKDSPRVRRSARPWCAQSGLALCMLLLALRVAAQLLAVKSDQHIH